MKLQARLVLLLALSLGAFLIVGIGTIHWVLNPAFERLEQDQALTNIKRVQRALQGELATMDQKLLDWSNWDDSNAFVRERTPDYIEGNLNASSIASLDLTFMAFYDRDGKPVWTGRLDAESQSVLPLLEMTNPSVYGRFLSKAEQPVVTAGLWIMPGSEAVSGAYLVSARPILNSQAEGPIVGTLVFGRRLDLAFAAKLRKQTEVSFRLQPQPPESFPVPAAAAEPHEIRRSETLLQHGVAWPDLTTRNGLAIVVDTPRAIDAVGQRTIHLVSLFLFAFALVDMIIIGMAVGLLIARPVRKLSDQVERIAESGDLSLRLTWNRRDEIGILATQFDGMIGKLETSADRAHAASRAKSHFLANMSHELRTPLNAIIGFSEIIASEVMGPVGNTRYRDYAAHIHDSSQHLLRIIADILDFSKIEAGKMQMQEEAVDLRDVVRFCLHVLEVRAENGGVAMRSQLPSKLPPVWGDALKLKQAVLNLMSNAVKFTPPGGQVTAEATIRPDGMVLVVTDTGVGMSADQIPLALEPFGQVENGFAKSYDGTGLGLPLARELIALHGGTLELESVPGEGTKAMITLPTARIMRRSDVAAE